MSNREMIEQYRPDLIEARLLEGSAATAKGDGHLILASHGAQLVQMGAVWIYIYATADHHDPDGRRGLAVRGARDQIWVNAQGRRFHNEDLSGGGSGTAAVMGQSPPVAWTIFDRAMADTLSIADPYYRPGGVTSRERHEEFLNENPNVRQAASIEELAALIQVPADTLVATVNQWNAQIARGDERDAQTGRPLRGRLGLVKPPFYAMRMMPLARKSLGGVKTDLACRVVRADGSIIEGLFAAGEVAGMAGGHINGTKALEGTLLGPAIFSGRVAGAWAAAMSGHGDGYHPSEPAMVPVSRKHEAHA
jgi:predicted oxidoreductase